MGRAFHLLALLCAFAFALPAAANEAYPRVVFPEGHVLAVDADGETQVETALVQVELAPGKIASAQRGARFTILGPGPSGGPVELRIWQGTLTLLDLRANALDQLAPGRYRLDADGARPVEPFPGRAGAAGDDAEAPAPSYRLSDAVMTQQQKYLDSLKVDVRDINKALASIIRALVPRQR